MGFALREAREVVPVGEGFFIRWLFIHLFLTRELFNIFNGSQQVFVSLSPLPFTKY